VETVRYLRALLTSWWLVVIAIAAGGLGGYYVYHEGTPLYSSSVRMIVAIEGAANDAQSNQDLAASTATSLVQIATTGPAISSAVSAAAVGQGGHLSISANASNSFVTVSVSDTVPRVAQAIASAFPRTLPPSLVSLSGGSANAYRLTIVAAPVLPTSPYSPKIKRDVGLGIAAGLILGLALAVLRETFNTSVRDSDALQDMTGFMVLGTVPRDRSKALLPAISDPRGSRAEAYRQIRTTLVSQTVQRPLTVAVSSATLGEGKTSVACNVAVSFSRAGHRVALVDADLRRPRVAKFFDVDPKFGLSEVLTGGASLEDAIVEVDEGRLGLVTCGRIPADPAELLGSQQMFDLLRQLESEYEFVIVDTPPILPVADALVVAPIVHCVILVAKIRGTTEERIRRAITGLERVNARIVGVVPNQATMGADRDYKYAYRYTPNGRGDSKSRSERTRAHGADGVTYRDPGASEGKANPAAPQGGRRRAAGGRRRSNGAGVQPWMEPDSGRDSEDFPTQTFQSLPPADLAQPPSLEVWNPGQTPSNYQDFQTRPTQDGSDS
jgi:receptor protein-tyrosine kinase